MWREVGVTGFLRFVFALLASDPPVRGTWAATSVSLAPSRCRRTGLLVRSYEKWRDSWSICRPGLELEAEVGPSVLGLGVSPARGEVKKNALEMRGRRTG